MWDVVVAKVEKLLEGHSTMCYLDFVKDVNEGIDILQNDGIKVGKYIGDMKIDEKKNVDHELLQGSISVLVATEAYELGVDNPNINQIIRFGCPGT